MEDYVASKCVNLTQDTTCTLSSHNAKARVSKPTSMVTTATQGQILNSNMDIELGNGPVMLIIQSTVSVEKSAAAVQVCNVMVSSDEAENSQDDSILGNNSTTSTSSISESNAASGASAYKAKFYLKKIKEMCSCFDKVAAKALRLEQNNTRPIAENLQFADLISAVGHELVNCGKKLEDSSQRIHKARSATSTKQLSVQVANSSEIVSAQQIPINVSETQQQYGSIKHALRK